MLIGRNIETGAGLFGQRFRGAVCYTDKDGSYKPHRVFCDRQGLKLCRCICFADRLAKIQKNFPITY